jgi:hypothetical protein
MKGVHESYSPRVNADGSQYFYAVYRTGNIVRLRDSWGVVTNAHGPHDYAPYVTWWANDRWTTAQRCMAEELSAPYVHTFDGIPDYVLAQATAVILLGES